MPMFALGVVMSLLSTYFTTEIGQALTHHPSCTANFTRTEMFVYSLLGLFSSSLASITFRAKLPSIASCFEDLTVACFVSMFASQLCMLTPFQHRWIVFSSCLIPLLPLDRSPCMLLFKILLKIPFMSQMGSCRGPESRFSATSPRRDGDGSEESSHSTLRNWIQGMPMFALGVVMRLLSTYFSTEIGEALTNHPSCTANFTPT